MRFIRRNSTLFSIFLSSILVLGFTLAATGEDNISGNEILEKVDQKSEVVSQGEILSILTLHDVQPDGSTRDLKLAALARKATDQPNRTLTYFMQPEGLRGSIFLSRDTEEGETRMWSYLPAYQRKIEVSASQKRRSFFGTTLTYEDIGNWNFSESFTAEIVEETQVEVGEETLSTYKLKLTPREGVEPEYPNQTIWVGKDNWLLLSSRTYDDEGELKVKMEVQEITTFEGNTVTKKLEKELVESGHSTTVIYEKRARPDQEIPDSVFDPENLSEFDPEKWGMTG
ncbi:MAG: outer membrane lipoprotein-sorting protein [Candidatus Bipolaricaulota bacterium]